MKVVTSPEDIEKLTLFSTPTVADAVDYFKVRDSTIGYASMGLKCLTPGQKPMVGFAITATVDTTTPGPSLSSSSGLRYFFDILEKSPKPVVIIRKYIGPDRSRSCTLGDMFSASVKKLGAVGIVTDCGIRDLSGIKNRASGISIFAPGVVASHGIARRYDINTVVSIYGLTIKPGDLLHGDENGIVNIPIGLIDIKKLIKRAETIEKEKKDFFNFLKSSSATLKSITNKLVRVI